MDVFEKIRAQQPEQRTAVWMVGEQLADIIRHDPAAQEIVSRDLDAKGMGLADCEKKIKAFADAHKTGNFAWIAKASHFGGGGCDQREQTERARLFASTTYLFLL